MTFSSLHERAQPTYARLGMRPRWQLHYWSGRTPTAERMVASTDVVDVAAAEWEGDRLDLVDHWCGRSARLLHIHDCGRLAGWAIVVPIDASRRTWAITRLSTDLPHDVAVHDVIATVEPGLRMVVCTPDFSTAGSQLARMGFEHVDTDVFCATDGLELPSRLAVVHAGLG